MEFRILASATLLAIAFGASAQRAPDAAPTARAEHPDVARSSTEFQSAADPVSRFLESNGLLSQLQGAPLGSTSTSGLAQRRTAIKAASPIPGIAAGDAAIIYDVILQPGHYGRTSGRTGTSGKLVSEQELTAFVARRAADQLRGAGLKVLVVSADGYRKDDPATPAYDGLRSRVFLAVHADGSERPCTTGPSLAYARRSSTYAMHALGWGLARALGYDYDDFRKDGFTAASAQYYMFNRVRASEMSGLLELGELTCPASETALVGNANAVAANMAHAVQFVLTVPFRTQAG